jgi:hypothetical protein
MSNVKVQISKEIQMTNPPSLPPFFKGGKGGLLIKFDICHSFDIWNFSFEL